MARVRAAETTKIVKISHEEGRELLDKQARRYLHMSGDEFVQAWKTGGFDDNPDRPEVMRVAMLIPFIR